MPEVLAKVSASPSQLHQGGTAKLGFRRSPDGVTYICTQEVAYPFHITRPFYLEGDPKGMSTLYIQSVSGGLFDNDVVTLSLNGEAQSLVNVTTQASTIVHETKTGPALQQVLINAGNNAFLEYLPDPMVLFPGARLHSKTRVTCDPCSSVMLCDGYFSHDPRSVGAVFEQLVSELRIETPQGRLRCLDRFDIGGEQLSYDNHYRAHGSFFCIDNSLDESTREKIDQSLSSIAGIYAGSSMLPDTAGIWGRVLAPDSQRLRDAIIAVWKTWRQIKTGLTPHLRKK